MAHSIDRSRREHELVNRSRFGRFDARRVRSATIFDDPETSAPKRPGQVPIRVVDPHAYAHHPASPADIRAILARLPDWILNGLEEIHLCRGTEEDLQPGPSEPEPADVVDAWIGRRGDEILPGVYCGNILGDYTYRSRLIRLHCMAYDPALPDRAMWEVLLRQNMLATLVHEVGHHRWARIRFPPDGRLTSEEFARKFEYAGIKRYVLPYLEEAYPAEVDRLLSWIQGHIGVRLSLASLQPDREDATASAFSRFTAGSAIEHLLEALSDGTNPREIRQDFARDIHYGGKLAEALKMVELLLEEAPDDFEALDLRACILRDQGWTQEAQAFARELTIRFPTLFRAWDRLVSANEDVQDWDGVVAAVNAIVALPDFSDLPLYQRDRTFLSRARANFGLGSWDFSLHDLERIAGRLTRRRAEQVADLRSKIAEEQAALAV
jgi:hypothetical protein